MNRSVLFVVPTLFPLGRAAQLANWVPILKSLGCDILIASLFDRDSQCFAARFAGAKVFNLDLRRRKSVAWTALSRICRDSTPDVIHLWDCGPALRIALRIAKRKFKGRLIETCFRHDDEMMDVALRRLVPPPVLVCSFDAELLDRRELLDHPPETKLLSKSPIRATANRAEKRNQIICEIGIPQDSVLISAVSPLVASARCKDLIWAVDILNCIRDDIHLLLCGTGPQLQRLRRFVGLTDVSDHIHFIGDRPDAPEIVCAADVFWQSNSQDAIPDGLLLAMARGVPVVSVYSESTAQLVRHQTTAMGTSPGRRDHFARWTKYLLEQESSRKKLTDQAAAFVQANFPEQHLIDQITSIYASS